MKKEYIDVRERTVVKANDLIQKSRFSLTVLQQKVVLYLISQVHTYDEDFKLYEFSIIDFCKACNIDYESGKHYQDLKDAIKEIADKSLWITLPDGQETLLRWIEKPYIDKKSGTIRIKLDRDMKPFLLQLKSNFTKYELIWTLQFKSKYSIRLYELVKSIHYDENIRYERVYKLKELKILLDAENYERYIHFKDRVLDPAIKEINEYSDKEIYYEPIKKGRSVEQIKLVINSKGLWEKQIMSLALEERYGLNQLSLFDENGY